MITILVPAAIALIGLLLYAFSANAKLQQVGLYTYAVGLLVALLHVGSAKWSL